MHLARWRRSLSSCFCGTFTTMPSWNAKGTFVGLWPSFWWGRSGGKKRWVHRNKNRNYSITQVSLVQYCISIHFYDFSLSKIPSRKLCSNMKLNFLWESHQSVVWRKSPLESWIWQQQLATIGRCWVVLLFMVAKPDPSTYVWNHIWNIWNMGDSPYQLVSHISQASTVNL